MTQIRQRLLTGLLTALLVVAPQAAAADDLEWAMRMCSVIDGMGAQTKCEVTESERAIDVTIDTAAIDAAQFCASYAGMLDAMASMLSADWKMRVFSNENADTPVASCDLG